jgi:hypothetical protein
LTKRPAGFDPFRFSQLSENLVLLFYVEKQAGLKNDRVTENDVFSPLVYVDIQIVDNNSFAVWVAIDKIITNKKS